MTSTRPRYAAGACGRPRHGVRVVDPAPLGSSRAHTRVSQQRDSCPLIQSLWPKCHMQRAMIGAMPEPRVHLLTDRPSDGTSYAPAYRCSYTVVYTEAKEVP
jgi:hypothetical protein